MTECMCTAAAVEAVVAKCSGGVRVAELCAIGDRCVEERVGFLFKTDPSIEKGFAQPTTVSLNNVCYNCSPDADDELEVAAVGAAHEHRHECTDVLIACVSNHSVFSSRRFLSTVLM
jgi:hypothetical protein